MNGCGVRGGLRAGGFAGALLLGLLGAYELTEPITRAVEKRFPIPPMRKDVLVFPSHPTGQFRSYLVSVAVTLLAVGVFALLAHLVRRRRWLAVAVDAATLACALFAARQVAPFFGLAALVLALPLAAVLAPHLARDPPRMRATPPVLLDAWAVVVETFCIFWGGWITTHRPDARLPALFPGVLAAVAGLWRVGQLLTARVGRDEALRREALAGLPLLALPLFGVLRAPSPLIVWAALALYLGLSLAARRAVELPAQVRRLARALPAVAAVWAITAIYSIPHKFRELPRINHNSHEAGKYAWLNSFYHGKLFMADTALLYGPLRELTLAIYVALAGKTAEHVRMGQILIHLGFLAATLFTVWIAARRQLWALVWGAFLVITTTLALPWLDVVHLLAFGWSDLGRIAFALFTIVGALELARGDRALAAWGAVATLSILYSQETGPAAVAAILVAIVVDSFARPEAFGWRGRAKRAGARAGAFLGGLVVTALLVVLVYALFGRGTLFVVTFYKFVSLFASGSLAGMPFPVNEHTFETWRALTANAPREGGFILEYVLPVAVYLVTGAALIAGAVTRPWSRRATLLLGLLVFGIGSHRVAMGRSDYYHTITVTAPAALLAVALAVDAASYLPRLRLARLPPIPLPLGVGLAALMIWGSYQLTGVTRGFDPRTKALREGQEVPSVGPAFAYPGIPRAGDIFLPPDTVELTHAIQKRTGPNDKIFVHASFIEHAELYFLADRVNPTRCDLLAEIVSTDIQDELRRDLQRDPPVLDVGSDFGMFNQATTDYLKSGWRVVERVNKIPISERVTGAP